MVSTYVPKFVFICAKLPDTMRKPDGVKKSPAPAGSITLTLSSNQSPPAVSRTADQAVELIARCVVHVEAVRIEGECSLVADAAGDGAERAVDLGLAVLVRVL